MANAGKSRDEIISSISSSLFSAMLHEVLMEAVLQSHKDAMRAKTVCSVCGLHCGTTHKPTGITNGTGSSSGTPAPKDKSDANIYFDCSNCQKKISSNRYAPHLSGCLGLGTGSRRGAIRNASAKNRLGADTADRASPFNGSDYGSPSLQETPNGKSKAKSKNTKKANGKAALDLNGSQKRPGAVIEVSPSKKKKLKTDLPPLAESSTSSNVPSFSRLPVRSAATSASPPAPPSPSVASASQYSGRDSPSISGSQGSFNAMSPNGLHRMSQTPYNKLPPKRHGPPVGAPRTHIPKVEEKEEDVDFVDVDGEEQSSSSSSDSSD
ncbi:hypothetical protein M422DRAFT_778912 [Sphaerobolus stellatus SS14]|uniref:SAGA-associated factor 11 n=1 Tax=Sphaerobolus stellatus (strain SS14) TaxID=990650 RepID=A0A0C9VT53_SPHS4|nr:hypothetical protein M422DRAFT_778912 [Sphaerobolus stellatus SS14]